MKWCWWCFDAPIFSERGTASRWPKSFGDGHIPASEARNSAALFGKDHQRPKEPQEKDKNGPSSYNFLYVLWHITIKPTSHIKWYPCPSHHPHGPNGPNGPIVCSALDATVFQGLLQQFPSDTQPGHTLGVQHQFLWRCRKLLGKPTCRKKRALFGRGGSANCGIPLQV